jgi:hypothetical protein
MGRRTVLSCLAGVAATCGLVVSGGAQASSTGRLAPAIDAHQHLRSPAAAAHSSDTPPVKVVLPPDLDSFLQSRIKAEMDKGALADLYLEHAWLLQS